MQRIFFLIGLTVSQALYCSPRERYAKLIAGHTMLASQWFLSLHDGRSLDQFLGLEGFEVRALLAVRVLGF